MPTYSGGPPKELIHSGKVNAGFEGPVGKLEPDYHTICVFLERDDRKRANRMGDVPLTRSYLYVRWNTEAMRFEQVLYRSASKLPDNPDIEWVEFVVRGS